MTPTEEMVRVAAEEYLTAYVDDDTSREVAMHRALTAALAAMWQPIETAPEHGDVLIFCPHNDGGFIWNGQRDFETKTWLDASGAEICALNIPTHWMPLPPAPTQLSTRMGSEKTSEG